MYVTYVTYIKESNVMERISFSEFRRELADVLDRVKYRGERIVVHRRGREAAAVVPLEDLARLEAETVVPARPPAKRRRRPGKASSGALELESLRRELGL